MNRDRQVAADEAPIIERSAVAKAFGRASSSYDSAADLQAMARVELLSRLEHFTLQPQVILDLGAGTGLATQPLRQRFPQARILSLDLAVPMLQQARERASISGFWPRLRAVLANRNAAPLHWLAGDASALPLASGSVQLVFSNLMLQWCIPPDRVLAEIRRVLAPGGLFLCSTFGPLTLQELRIAWAAVDEQPHVNDFLDMHDIGSAMTRAGLVEPVLDTDRLQRKYTQVMDLLRELKNLGAGNSLQDRRRSLTGKSRLTAMLKTYQDQFSTQASWEIIYGSAFAPSQSIDSLVSHASPVLGTEVNIPLASLTKKLAERKA